VRGAVKVLATLAAGVLLGSGVGCWDRLEPDRMACVIALGLDRGEHLPVRITAQVSIPRLLAGGGGREGGGGQAVQRPFDNRVAEGRGVFEAMRVLQEECDRIIHLGHLQVVVVSEQLARTGLAPLLDYVTSEREARRVVEMAVSSCPPRDVLDVPTRLESLPGTAIAERLRQVPTTMGLPESTIIRFLNALHDEGIEPFLPVVHRVDARGEIVERPPGAREEAGRKAQDRGRGDERAAQERQATDRGGPQGGEDVIRVAGVAVFKDDRMVGTLNELEARGLAWLMGRLERGILVVPAELVGGGPALLYVRRVEAKFEPRLESGRPSMKVRLKVRADVAEWLAPRYDLTPSEADRLEQAAARVIADETMATVRRLQKEFRSDVCGFGWTFYRRYPREWRRDLGPRWDELFADLPVQLQVKVHVSSAFFGWRSSGGPWR
jgi:spore germination protein KC